MSIPGEFTMSLQAVDGETRALDIEEVVVSWAGAARDAAKNRQWKTSDRRIVGENDVNDREMTNSPTIRKNIVRRERRLYLLVSKQSLALGLGAIDY